MIVFFVIHTNEWNNYIIKGTEKQYWIEQNNIIKITEKCLGRKRELNIENYQMKKKI